MRRKRTYSTKGIYEQSKELVEKHKLISFEDIISLLTCNKTTFYNYIKAGGKEHQHLQELIDKNKVKLKVSMRAKWYQSDNATLQLALYRMLANADEHKALNQHYVDHTSKGNKLSINIIEAKDDE